MVFDIEQTLIVLLVSSWLNMALYTLELVLVGQYFRRPARPLAHKIGVGVLVTFDTICTLAGGFDAVWSVVRNLQTDTSLPLGVLTTRLLLTPLAIEIVATYTSSVISQLFLCNLSYMLTGSKPMAGVLLLLIFSHLALSWTSAIIMLKTVNMFGISFTFATAGEISCAATDIIIAVSLAWKFWTMMGRTMPQNSTRSLMRRILIVTISSGAICAGNTLLMTILLLNNSEVFNFFFACQGRVYALTLLGNFLVGIPRAARKRETTATSGTTGGGHGRHGPGSHSTNILVFQQPNSASAEDDDHSVLRWNAAKSNASTNAKAAEGLRANKSAPGIDLESDGDPGVPLDDLVFAPLPLSPHTHSKSGAELDRKQDYVV
ncbi:hypothetical protein B0H11DRAFT_1343383 [Mycena galericulata]|nr:hypothetical protein B0H11DRAFT_1343383 [Mycena galericulata]